MDYAQKQDLKTQIQDLLEAWGTTAKYAGEVSCTATIEVQFTFEVEKEIDGNGFILKDASGEDSLRLVIEEGSLREQDIHDGLYDAASLRLDDFDVDDLVEAGHSTGFAEVTDIQIEDVDDIRKVGA